ncbi:hypothetical protein EIN_080210 [Entamoeba invadens IP1]|uniref:hypothetical protein n=1 Tax=Entamoeba invadens IP1 TaxID=370355 RepID=UPI0002C3E329|nr:hypothetical protein EIN_080210 [Entamoeba invadens IP1]ELP85069.1 hypothetical protein EIN_080210 [Entamoeba invadens IP1]|eukprot:XP_004184415.1 hypothetical protein EIN_080210 [Entamoeba invadens IP1]
MTKIEAVYIANIALHITQRTVLDTLIKVSKNCCEGVKILKRNPMMKWMNLKYLFKLLPNLVTVVGKSFDILPYFKEQIQQYNNVLFDFSLDEENVNDIVRSYPQLINKVVAVKIKEKHITSLPQFDKLRKVVILETSSGQDIKILIQMHTLKVVVFYLCNTYSQELPLFIEELCQERTETSVGVSSYVYFKTLYYKNLKMCINNPIYTEREVLNISLETLTDDLYKLISINDTLISIGIECVHNKQRTLDYSHFSRLTKFLFSNATSPPLVILLPRTLVECEIAVDEAVFQIGNWQSLDNLKQLRLFGRFKSVDLSKAKVLEELQLNTITQNVSVTFPKYDKDIIKKYSQGIDAPLLLIKTVQIVGSYTFKSLVLVLSDKTKQPLVDCTLDTLILIIEYDIVFGYIFDNTINNYIDTTNNHYYFYQKQLLCDVFCDKIKTLIISSKLAKDIYTNKIQNVKQKVNFKKTKQLTKCEKIQQFIEYEEGDGVLESDSFDDILL